MTADARASLEHLAQALWSAEEVFCNPSFVHTQRQHLAKVARWIAARCEALAVSTDPAPFFEGTGSVEDILLASLLTSLTEASGYNGLVYNDRFKAFLGLALHALSTQRLDVFATYVATLQDMAKTLATEK